MMRIYGLTVHNRPAAIALAVTALAVGAIVVAFGIVLLIALAAAGTLIATATVLYRSLTGRRAHRLGSRDKAADLDPSLEVFPSEAGAHKLTSRHAHKPRTSTADDPTY